MTKLPKTIFQLTIEVVACDQGSALQVLEILNAPDLLDYQLLVLDEVVDKSVGKLEGHLGLCLLLDASVKVVDVLGHEHWCGRIVLHVLVKAS